jgi:DNA-binding NarL/FixJ family response regulator
MQPVPQTIQVVLADDHHVVRAGLRSLLNGMKDVTVVAEVADGRELIKVLETIRPDVVVTDIAMPGMDGITAIEQIRGLHPTLRIIILSMHQSADIVKKAVAAGANGFVRKDAGDFELEATLRNVVASGSHFGAEVVKALMTESEPAAEDELTPRQIQILKLIAGGKSAKEIGFELELSAKTVDVHRSRIMARLGMHDIASLTLYAVRKGLLKI